MTLILKPGRTGISHRQLAHRAQGAQIRFDLCITVDDALLTEIIKLHGLRQLKDMLVLVVALKLCSAIIRRGARVVNQGDCC